MKKRIAFIPLLTLLCLPFAINFHNCEMIETKAVTNETHANGSGYYSTGKLAQVNHGWPFIIYPYTSDFEFQFLVEGNYGKWGDYTVTMLTMKLDVSQELGKHKVYTLEGSKTGWRMFDENNNKIAEKQNDASTTLVGSDTNTAGTFFWNRSDENIEIRIPYKTLCGEDYTGTPIIGVAAQSYYANGEGFDWAGYSKYSDEFNDLDDPSTYTRITYNPDGPANTNYTTQKTAVYNVYNERTTIHIDDNDFTLTYGESYSLTHEEISGRHFVGFNFASDGSGEYFLESGVYYGDLPTEITLYPIYDSGIYTITFMIDDQIYSSETYSLGENVDIPLPPEIDGKIFSGWYDGDNKIGDTLIAEGNKTYHGTYKNAYIIKFGEDDEVGTKFGEGDVIIPPSTYSSLKPGYVLDGWVDIDGNPLTSSTVATQNATYYPASHFKNDTHAEGNAYYGVSSLITLSGGLNAQIIPYSSYDELQFLIYQDDTKWDTEDKTSIILKLDVSQEALQHKVYTLKASLSGVSLYDESDALIVQKLGTSSTSALATDVINEGNIYWNHSSNLFNLEIRIPYVTLVGNSYNFEEAMPVIGVAAQSFRAPDSYSNEFGVLNDPTTYKRVTFKFSSDPTKNNIYAFDAKVNVGTKNTVATLITDSGTSVVNLVNGEQYDLGQPFKEHYVFKEWNTSNDGAGISVPSIGVYDGSFPETITLYPIYEAERYLIKFGNYDSVEYEYGEVIIIPEGPTKENDEYYSYTFIGWFNGDKQIHEGDIAEEDVVFIAKYEKTLLHDDTIIIEEENKNLSKGTLIALIIGSSISLIIIGVGIFLILKLKRKSQ